jgi:hypothetical protein
MREDKREPWFVYLQATVHPTGLMVVCDRWITGASVEVPLYYLRICPVEKGSYRSWYWRNTAAKKQNTSGALLKPRGYLRKPKIYG